MFDSDPDRSAAKIRRQYIEQPLWPTARPAPLSAALDPSTISQGLTRLAASAPLLIILATGRVAVAQEDCAPPALTAGSSAALHARMGAALPRLMDAFAVPGAALALIEQGRVRSTRGFGVVYSGGGFTPAQLMLGRQSGRPFAELALERVLDPLGMDASSFPPRPAPSSPLAWTFDADGSRAAARSFTALAAAGLRGRPPGVGGCLLVRLLRPLGHPLRMEQRPSGGEAGVGLRDLPGWRAAEQRAGAETERAAEEQRARLAVEARARAAEEALARLRRERGQD